MKFIHKGIENLITKLSTQFKEKRLSLVTAESCTGGGLAFMITRTPSASSILERGYVTYSPKAKEELLGVKLATLEMHGAVSKQTANEMARGALKNSKAQVSVAITGLAGPDNENEKGTGVVWIACASSNKKTKVILKKIPGTRKEFTKKTIIEAIRCLLDYTK